MGRLEPLRAPATDAQRELWRHLADGPRGATAVRPEGFLTGPFDVLLRAPEVGRAVTDLGSLLRYGSALAPRVRETAIITVAARWRAGFSWLRHDEYARAAGVSAEAVAAVAAGRTPDFDDEGDRVVHAFVHQLAHAGRADDETYAAALALLGERQLVELVALTGYYGLTSLLLNAFEVPLPQGAAVPWAGDAPGAGAEENGHEREEER